jgi:hypothetical protein
VLEHGRLGDARLCDKAVHARGVEPLPVKDFQRFPDEFVPLGGPHGSNFVNWSVRVFRQAG